MYTYFDHPIVSAIRSDEIFNLLGRANKRPNDFIRIELTDEKMHISKPDKGKNIEFPILEATLIFRRKDGQMERYDISHKSTDICFLAAIQPRMFMVYLLSTPDQTREGRMMFDKNETFLGMFKTDTSTLFITYDGEMEYFGYGFCLEYEGYPSVYHLIREAMDTTWEKGPHSVVQ